jgi:hypothetical protein
MGYLLQGKLMYIWFGEEGCCNYSNGKTGEIAASYRYSDSRSIIIVRADLRATTIDGKVVGPTEEASV